MTQAAILAASGSPGTTTGFKNRIINGGMQITQRGTASVTAVDSGATFPVDRFFVYSTPTSKFTAQVTTANPSSTGGQTACLGITSSSAFTVTSGTLGVLEHRIEGYNVADLQYGYSNAKTVTLSFWVYCSLTGTFGGSIVAGSGTRSYPFTYTISSANTWQQISVTIPGDTTTVNNTTTGTGLIVSWSMGAGSVYSGTAGSWQTGELYNATGSVNLIATNGATFYITGCQLEVGTTATNFDFRSIGTELSLCQRYCFAFNDSTSAGNASYGVGNVFNASNINICGFFPISMRIAPTGITVTSPTSFFIGTGGSNTTTSSISYGGCSTSSYGLSCAATGVTSGTVILLNNSRGGQLLWSAEL